MKKYPRIMNNLRKVKSKTSCPICKMKINSNIPFHIAKKHGDFTSVLIELYNSQSDFEYFMSCLIYENH